MSLRERIEKWWTASPGEAIGLFIGLWVIMFVSASLFQVILMELP